MLLAIDNPTWVKMKLINGYEYWFGLNSELEDRKSNWKVLRSGSKPH